MKASQMMMGFWLALSLAMSAVAAPDGGLASARERFRALSLMRLSGPEAEGAWILVVNPPNLLQIVYDDLVLLEAEIPAVPVDGDPLGSRLRHRARQVVKYTFMQSWRGAHASHTDAGPYSNVFADTVIDACLLPLALPADPSARLALAKQAAIQYFDLSVDAEVIAGQEKRIVVPGTLSQCSTEWSPGDPEASFLFNFEDYRGFLKKNRLSWAVVTVDLKTLIPRHQKGLYRNGIPPVKHGSP